MEMRYSKTYDFYHEGGKTTDYQNKKNKARREDPEYREMERLYALKNNILFRYGITLEERDKMILDQDNKCLMCGEPFEGKGQTKNAPAVDHDHSFKKGDPNSIRAIIHNKCNTRIGIHHDSIEQLQISIDYLKKYGVS